MNIEEAKRIAMGLRTDFKCESDTMVDFCNTIIKALEQENVLDKIRDEIMQLDYDIENVNANYDYNNMTHTVCREEVLHIIDKYKIDKYKADKVSDRIKDKEIDRWYKKVC